MDGLSGAGSVFAVVSLAIQLGDGINKLYIVLSSMKSASKDIESLVKELDYLRTILDEIRYNEEKFGPHPGTTKALERCSCHIGDLISITESLNPGFESKHSVTQVWTALSAIRKRDKIAQLKLKLQETKTTLLLAQQSSATRMLHVQNQTFQEALLILTRNVSNELSYERGEPPTFHKERPGLLGGISSEIRRVSSLWPGHPFQLKLEEELARTIQTTVVNVLQNQQAMTSRKFSRDSALSDESSKKPKRRGIKMRRTTTTQTLLGQIHCSVSVYRSNRLEDKRSYQGDGRMSFRFIPSWLMMKLGFSKTLSVDMFELYTYGWQRAIHTFNLIPDDSLLFRFCRDGNFKAVKHLILEGKGSVRDINSIGETALHIAANRSHADVCSFLIETGADTELRTFNGFERTPFLCACWPADENEDGSISGYSVYHQDLVDTLQVFVSAGEDLDVLTGDDAPRHALFAMPDVLKDEGASSARLWLLNFALSKIGPSAFDELWWRTSLIYILRCDAGPEHIVEVLRYCDRSVVRWALCEHIDHFYRVETISGNQLRNVQLLLERTEGINFLHTSPWSGVGSPISIASRRSATFMHFRTVLIESGYDLEELIRAEVELHDNGWTETTLRNLFMADFVPLVPCGLFCCRKCGEDVRSFIVHGMDMGEPPWERKLQRIKDGLDPDEPLTSEEAKKQQEWDGCVAADKNRICQDCYEKDIRISEVDGDEDDCSPFLLYIGG